MLPLHEVPVRLPFGRLETVDRDKEAVRMGMRGRSIKRTCLAWQGTLCRSCYDECPIYNEALIMDSELRPVVNEKKCVGCGICENVCPLDSPAIRVNPEENGG